MMMAPTMGEQRVAWEWWNAETREKSLGEISTDQRDHVQRWLQRLGRHDLHIIDVGCGAGWLTPTLTSFGYVTATDLSSDLLARAQLRFPLAKFVPGDFMALPFPQKHFDAVISLEVLAHVEDQPAFVAKLASLLSDGGLLMLATQNKPVLEKLNNVPPPPDGALRRWVDEAELRALLDPHFEVLELKAITPRVNRYPWRLVCNNKADKFLHALFGNAPKRLKERLGWGWTLMTLARKRKIFDGLEQQ